MRGSVRYGIVIGGLTAIVLTAWVVTRWHGEPAPVLVPGSSAVTELPPITMTSGGGFAGTAWIWSISPDGSWTYQVQEHGQQPAQRRSGQLSEAQRRQIAALATDPALQTELRVPRPKCNVSDGEDERLKVGPVERIASWCKEDLPNITRLRDWILATTTGP
jgi:hypothetical protein